MIVLEKRVLTPEAVKAIFDMFAEKAIAACNDDEPLPQSKDIKPPCLKTVTNAESASDEQNTSMVIEKNVN